MKRIVPGIHSVSETLKVRPENVNELWLREGKLNPELEEIQQIAEKHGIKVRRTSPQHMDRQVGSHQGVIAYVDGGPLWHSGSKLKDLEAGLILALDGIEDPHNVGSLMRTAWGLGAKGVLVTKERSANFAPAAQKVATGAFEHVPMEEVSNLASDLISLKELGFWIYGLDGKSTQVLVETDFAPKCVIVIGSEERGIRKPVLAACDVIVKIPQAGSANSYNASVAGAIAGFEFFRQRTLAQAIKNSTEKI